MGALKEHLQYFFCDSWIKVAVKWPITKNNHLFLPFSSPCSVFPPSSFSSSSPTLRSFTHFSHNLFLLSFFSADTPCGRTLYIKNPPKKKWDFYKHCMEILFSHASHDFKMGYFCRIRFCREHKLRAWLKKSLLLFFLSFQMPPVVEGWIHACASCLFFHHFHVSHVSVWISIICF